MYSAHTSITVPLQKIYHFIWNECLWDWLNPSICHDQQNTSPVREICVFGEKNKKQFGIITLQQHVHRFTALEKNIIFSNRMAKELYQIRLWRTRYLRVRICILLRDRLSVISMEYLPTYWPYWEKGLCNWKLKYNSFKNFLFCKWMY